jgi:hypothetical protein
MYPTITGTAIGVWSNPSLLEIIVHPLSCLLLLTLPLDHRAILPSNSCVVFGRENCSESAFICSS